MTFTVTINMDNAAFEDESCGAEVSRILHDLSNRVDSYSASDIVSFDRSLFDVNGNKCGRVEVKE